MKAAICLLYTWHKYTSPFVGLTLWDWGQTFAERSPDLEKRGLWEQAWGPAVKRHCGELWAYQVGYQGGC